MFLKLFIVVCLVSRFAFAQELFANAENDESKLSDKQSRDIFDVWDDKFEDDNERDLMDDICRNTNYVILDKVQGKSYDCLSKQWRDLDEVRVKRDVEEEVEGSGNGEENKVEETDNKVEETADNVEETDNKVEESAVKVEDTADKVEETDNKVEESAVKVEDTADKVEETVSVVPETENKGEEKSPDDAEPKKNDTEPQENSESEKSVPEIVVDIVEKSQEVTDSSKPIEAQQNEVNPNQESLKTTEEPKSPNEDQKKEVPLIPIHVGKKGRRIDNESSDTETVTIPETPEDNPEKIDKFQDGNTLTSNHQEIDNNSDKAPILSNEPKLAEEKEIKGEDQADVTSDETPKTGQATKDAKDSNILIMLFVGVVVVGLAAFGYNFIRKRRRSNIPPEQNLNEVKIEEKKPENPTKPEEIPLMNGKPEQQSKQETEVESDHQEVYRPTTSAIK